MKILSLRATTVPILCSFILLIWEVESFAPNSNSHRAVTSHGNSLISTSTVLFPHHQFSGYDASVSAEVTWNPNEAAEFVIWHAGDPKQAGMQLSRMIKGWSGSDVGEFLSRLFLGELDKDNNKISYCPSNVRDPKWLGLGEDGIEAMKDLLMTALPDDVLSAAELARCGRSFLLKEHRWPKETDSSENNNTSTKYTIEFESDSFGSRGHSADIAGILGYVRKNRLNDFTPKDVIQMISLRELNQDHASSELSEFWSNLGIQMTPSEKVETVEGMALSGWGPSNIAQFVCSIQDIEERIIQVSTSVTESTVVSVTQSVSVSEETSAPAPEVETESDVQVPAPSAYFPAHLTEAQKTE